MPGVTAEKPQTVISGYLNMIEVVGFLFRYLQFSVLVSMH